MPSPSIFDDATVRVYLALTSGMLATGGGTLAVMRWGFRRNVAHAWSALRGWLVIVPPLAAALLAGRVATIAFFAGVACFAFRELAHASGLARERELTVAVYVAIVALHASAIAADGASRGYATFASVAAIAIAALVAVPVVRGVAEGQLRALALAVFGFVYLGWLFGHVALLASTPHAFAPLLFLLVAVEVNDVAAYTFGRIFGRRRLAVRLSPTKTWEGAAGALAISLALPWAMRFSLPGFDALDLVLAGLVVGVGGQIGDLAVSAIKRDLGLKDMGTAIRGHGGVLDRIDSLVFVAPLYYMLVCHTGGLS